MGTITKNFSFWEFACSCGKCSFVDGYQIDNKLVRDLQIIRNGFGKEIRVNSGLRCSDFNRSIGGSPNSYHVLARACDISCTTSRDRYLLVRLALGLGLAVGISKTFIHIDNRDTPIIFLY